MINFHSLADPLQLFLQFHGPATLLLQTRAARIRDTLTDRDVNEITAKSPGTINELLPISPGKETKEASSQPVTPQHKPPKMSLASISQDGKVTFEKGNNTKQ